MVNDTEWLESDGSGGFASGTATGIPSRRYHGLLLCSRKPPTERYMLVNAVEATLSIGGRNQALSSFRYDPGVIHPDGRDRIERFTIEPWPTWTYRFDGGLGLTFELFVPNGRMACCLAWRIEGANKPLEPVILTVRPLISGRDYHSLHVANHAFSFLPEIDGCSVTWQPYKAVPKIRALSSGEYRHEPNWYKNFEYLEELHRGFECKEDLASPGGFSFDLAKGQAVLILEANGSEQASHPPGDAGKIYDNLKSAETKRRKKFGSPLTRAADAYVVERSGGKTIVAGYPWFTDWGRDSFISLRGLCLVTGRHEDAKQILLEWSSHVSRGMIPNRFPDKGEEPEYNSVDAALWFVVAAGALMKLADGGSAKLAKQQRAQLEEAIQQILTGYRDGTRFGIRCDPEDGLIAAGEHGSNLTWMDARIHGHEPVTPRIGKPVEIQALWINALEIGGAAWKEQAARARRSFEERFWNEAAGCLFDVVDEEHVRGTSDGRIRPNQIFAVGGLPSQILSGDRARRVVDTVERELLTPLGLRTLSPSDSQYFPTYVGDSTVRDMAYHQGTVWPWLIGPFVEAWVRSRGGGDAAKKEARQRFLAPLLAHLDEAGLGHISEIADGEAPHTPRGCPFQAWSVAEALRLDMDVLA